MSNNNKLVYDQGLDETSFKNIPDDLSTVDLSTDVDELDYSTSVDKETGISHKDVMELLSLTMLVYDYGKSIPYILNDTIENFVSRSATKEIDLPVIKKQAITFLQKNCEDGKICNFVSDPDTDLQAGITISEKNKRITIIFRGSESTYDWYYDLNFIKKCINKDDNVYVHNGFHKQLVTNGNDVSLTNIVKELLDEHPDFHVYVCGHSLGGALCTLYGYLLSHEIEQIVTVISFASPRVGNSGWKKSFDEKSNLIHYRVTNNNDIVTSFPTIFYYHVGNNIRLERNSKASFLYNYSYSWWDYSVFKCHSFSDHYCDQYYKYLIDNKW